MNNAGLIVETLQRAGVKWAFGVPSSVRLGDPPQSPEHYFGVPVHGARSADELSSALDWAFAHDGSTVIEAFIDAAPYSQTVYD
ncbi:MAG TPA: hypothetical protein VFS30_04355 [Dehalococcoidia bacterium]|nr:hypothetical protein [Dehalococcoidia bacterium]